MTTRVWAGGPGSWTDATQWLGGVAPLPDDTEQIGAGAVTITAGANLDAADLVLDGPGTVVAANSVDFGNRCTIDATALATTTLLADGNVGCAGTITASAGTLDLAGAPAAAANTLYLLDGAQMQASGGCIALTGTLANQATITIGAGSSFINDGTVIQAHAAFEVESGGTLAGSGGFDIGLFSSLYLQPGAAPSAQNVTFTAAGGRLLLGDPATYSGTIINFRQGDLIDLTTTVADTTTYDAADGLLTVQDLGATVATLHMQNPATGTLIATTDGSGGTLIQLAGTQPRVDYTIGGPDQAMGAATVRSTMTTPAGTPITGAGVKIGIISNSFDALPGFGTLDVANAAALAGLLPLNAAGTGSAVTVLSDVSGSGYDNEGLAMAEAVHQVAPGAALYFATGEGGLTAFANAVSSLVTAGCQVIVDDVSYYDEPFFQNAGTLDAAIEAAVAHGVSYFTAAGNAGDAAFQASYAPQTVTLYNGQQIGAEQFGTGTPYQTLTLQGGETVTIALQWAAPYPPAGQTAPDMLSMALFDGSGNLVASSVAAGDAPEATLTFAPTVTTQYQLAITGPLPAGTSFKYVLFGAAGGGSGPGGTIDDPAANAGTVIGHAMLANVNTIGAIDYADTPAFGSTASWPDYYSATGPADLLLNPNGHAAASPVVAKPSLLAPAGAATSISGFASFSGTSAAAPNAAAVAALMLQADPNLTPAQISAMLAQSALNLGLPATAQGAGLVQAPGAVALALAAAACFATGTRIATDRGPIAVERLHRGDLVRLAGGGTAPVIWLGRRRIDCRTRSQPAEVWPVRIAAHAVAPGQPARDLLLSPDHAVLLDGALIPVRYLLNGATIAQMPRQRVCYWHVELPAHGVLLAEGLPAESYLDTGNRGAFEGEAGPAGGDPAEALRRWQAHGCAPLLIAGAPLARVRAGLLRRARRLGHTLTDAAALTVLAGGQALTPQRDGGTQHYRLPPRVRRVRLLSRSWVPAELGAGDADAPPTDARRLGVAVAGLRLDGTPLALDDARLGDGWHAPERFWRWTAGDAGVAVAGARVLAFDLAITGRYWQRR